MRPLNTDHNFLKFCVCLFADFFKLHKSLHETQSIRTCDLRSTTEQIPFWFCAQRTQRKTSPRCAQHWQRVAESSAGSSHTWMGTVGKQSLRNELPSLQQGISLAQGRLSTVAADAWYKSETLKQGPSVYEVIIHFLS